MKSSAQFARKPPSLDFQRREQLLRDREKGPRIVKVILPVGDSEATIYREGRLGLKHQELTDAEREMMGDDESAFFVARWSFEEIKWVLVKRTTGW